MGYKTIACEDCNFSWAAHEADMLHTIWEICPICGREGEITGSDTDCEWQTTGGHGEDEL